MTAPGERRRAVGDRSRPVVVLGTTPAGPSTGDAGGSETDGAAEGEQPDRAGEDGVDDADDRERGGEAGAAVRQLAQDLPGGREPDDGGPGQQRGAAEDTLPDRS